MNPMPKVELHAEGPEGVTGLPRVCMRCGGAATNSLVSTFRWHPQWISYILVLTVLVGLIFLPIALILAAVLNKSMRVEMPLCDRHRHPWRWQRIALYGGLLTLVGLITVMVALFALSKANDAIGVIGTLLLVLTLLYFPIWLVVAAVVGQNSIHAAGITEHSIKLVSVSREFADAVLDEEDEAYRARRLRRRDRAERQQKRSESDDPIERRDAGGRPPRRTDITEGDND
jgi:hypothetical protein